MFLRDEPILRRKSYELSIDPYSENDYGLNADKQ